MPQKCDLKCCHRIALISNTNDPGRSILIEPLPERVKSHLQRFSSLKPWHLGCDLARPMTGRRMLSASAEPGWSPSPTKAQSITFDITAAWNHTLGTESCR